MAALGEHFLIGLFADYYQELVRAKRAINNGKLAEYLDMVNAEKELTNQELVGALFRRLKALLTQQQRHVRANATHPEQLDYLKVLYAACALTDEQFLFEADWEDPGLWQQGHLLEKAFFGTDLAGSRIYEFIGTILNDRVRVGNQSDLAAVYLMILTLGFKGKFRNAGMVTEDFDFDENKSLGQSVEQALANQGELESQLIIEESAHADPIELIKNKIYRVLETPLEQDKVFAQAYRHLLHITEDPKEHRITPLSNWYRYGIWGALGYLIVSSILWISLTNGLEAELHSAQPQCIGSSAEQEAAGC